VAGVLAYRGPLGLNLSFLENRCDLLVDPDLSASRIARIVPALMRFASEYYQDFAPGFIPVACDDAGAAVLTHQLGGQFVRQYCQGIWLRDAFVDMYRHFEQFYGRIIRRYSHRPMLAVG